MGKTLTGHSLNSGLLVAIYPDPSEADLGLSDLATSDGAQDVTITGSAAVLPEDLGSSWYGRIAAPIPQEASLPIPPSLVGLSGAPWTFSIWFKLRSPRPSTNNYRPWAINGGVFKIDAKDSSGTGEWWCRLNESASPMGHISFPAGDNNIPTDTLIHHVWVYDGAVWKIIQNGGQIAGQDTDLAPFAFPDWPLYFNQNKAPVDVYSVRFYSRALTDQEVADLYNAGLSGDSALVTSGGVSNTVLFGGWVYKK